jgi:2-methylcitrate dehydratase PrpD
MDAREIKQGLIWGCDREFMPTQYIPAKKFRAMVIGLMSREMMYGDTLHTCKELSANIDRIEVEGHHGCLRIMVSQSRKTR